MKEYTNTAPEFSPSIQVVETTDPAHAENINAATKQLLDNTFFNYKEIAKRKYKTYLAFNQINPDYNAGNFSYKNLPAGSIICTSINKDDSSDAYNNGLIPVEKTGILLAVNASNRGFAVFIQDNAASDVYIANSNNMKKVDLTAWGKVVKAEDVLSTLEEVAANTDGSMIAGASAVKELAGRMGITLTATLTAGAVSVTFTDPAITDDSLIDVYTDVYGVNPTDMTYDEATHTLTVTFDQQAADVGVKVRVM